jgi:hypothetical protein
VQKFIARIPAVNVPRAIQEKIHFRLYHDLREKGLLPDGFPVPCDPYYRVEDRLPSYRDGVVEGEFVTVRVRRANGRRENARFNLLKGGFDGETFAAVLERSALGTA